MEKTQKNKGNFWELLIALSLFGIGLAFIEIARVRQINQVTQQLHEIEYRLERIEKIDSIHLDWSIEKLRLIKLNRNIIQQNILITFGLKTFVQVF